MKTEVKDPAQGMTIVVQGRENEVGACISAMRHLVAGSSGAPLNGKPLSRNASAQGSEPQFPGQK